jgi:SAM-dependent methyltransferase
MNEASLWMEDNEATVRYFTERVTRFGVDVQAVDWGSRASQENRFAVLAGIGDIKGARILDVGCGQGDLYGWLTHRGIPVDYLGLDIVPAMVETARKRYPEGDFRLLDVLNPATDTAALRCDFALASGIFYRRKHDPYGFLTAMAARLLCLARRGVAFNCLSSWHSPQEPDEFYGDPAKVVAICAGLTPRLALRHDYHPGDFTVFLHPRWPHVASTE